MTRTNIWPLHSNVVILKPETYQILSYLENLVSRPTTILSGEYANPSATLSNNKNVGVGNTHPQNNLDVNGTIYSGQVNVDVNGCPDFVFQPSLYLPLPKKVKT